MTRINTNVASINAQKSLARSEASLQQALTRLSTGLRINTGKDDPAGLIASEILRSDIVGVQKGISNSHRANQMVATADSALGQVSNLLNDIRGLISEAANTGTMSLEMIMANQLQVDSSLEAIDRIAQTTAFQGGPLLDGSLDFVTKYVDREELTELYIDQANLGTQEELDITIDVIAKAEKAKLVYPFNAIPEDLVVTIGGVDGFEAFTFDSGATIQEMAAAINLVSDATGVEASVEEAATKGHIIASSAGDNNNLIIQATQAGKNEGNIDIKYTKGHSGATNIAYDKSLGDNDPNTINVECEVQAYIAAAVKQLDDTAPTTAAAAAAQQTVSINTTQVTSDRIQATTDVTETTLSTGIADPFAAAFDVTFTANNADGAAFLSVAPTQLDVSVSGGGNAGWDGTTIGGAGNTFSLDYQNTGTAPSSSVAQLQTALQAAMDLRTVGAGDITISVTNPASNFLTNAGSTIAGPTSLTDPTAAAQMQINATTSTGGAIDLNALTFAGADLPTGTRVESAIIDNGDGTYDVNVLLDSSEGSGSPITADEIATSLNTFATGSNFDLNFGVAASGNAIVAGDTTESFSAPAISTTGAYGANQASTIDIDANQTGWEYNVREVQVVRDETLASNTAQASFDTTTGILQVDWNATGAATITDIEIETAINTDLGAIFTASNTAGTIALSDTNAIARGSSTTTQLGSSGLQDYMNNALDITARIPGSMYNDADVRVIDIANVPQRGVTATDINYEYDAQAAEMVVSGFLNATTTELQLISTTDGLEYNDVEFQIIDAATPADVAVRYYTDSTGNKILEASVEPGITTLDDLALLIQGEGTFDATVSGPGGAAFINAGDKTAVSGNTYNTGGDKNTLFLYVNDSLTTANDIVNALQDPKNAQAAALFDIQSSIDNDGSGVLHRNTFIDALQGGIDGGAVIATAEDVMNTLAATDGVKDLVTSQVEPGDTGLSAVTVFEMSASFGELNAGTGLRFLAPDDSRDIRFVSEPGTDLSVDFTTYPDTLGNSSATLAAYDKDAAFTLTASNEGPALDDMIVRFKAAPDLLAGGPSINENVVAYDPRPSTSEAYLTFDDTGHSDRNIILSAFEHGHWMNDVEIIMQLDNTLVGTNAIASFNDTNKQLTITVNNAADANDVVSAVNDDADDDGEPDSGFQAQLDYSADYTNDGTDGSFQTWITANGANDRAVVANTGDTGGHEGGTLELLIRSGSDGTDDYASANNIMAAISSDDIVGKMFGTQIYGSSNTGQGLIDYRGDTNKMVTAGGVADAGYMTVHLATSEDGLITTTAKDLVDYFDTLSDADTRGISASLMQDSEFSNIGGGLLSTTYPELDATGSPILDSEGAIEFASDGLTPVERQASGITVAQNGIKAQLAINAVRLGTEYDDTEVVVQGDPNQVGVDVTWDETLKRITIRVPEATGASVDDVTTAFNSALGDYFYAEQAFPDAIAPSSTAFVMPDDATILKGGEVMEGTANGAAFVGNADVENKGLTIQSVEYGSRQFVSLRAHEGTIDVYDTKGEIAERDNVDMGERIEFTITGGGATFQLGPDVVSNQQARLGIQSINTTQLGGEEGKLFELRTGGNADLANDTTKAFRIIESAIVSVTQIRGRLGAFQRTTIETNIASLSDTLEALTAAESSIRDTDFASESAELTRSQVLVQSGISVLGIANQNPQAILSLLR